MVIRFVNPATGNFLNFTERGWVDPTNGDIIAPVINGVPRFVDPGDGYADSFGWQWTKWDRLHRLSHNPKLGLHKLLRDRTHFDELETRDKTILECGCGAGGDTEYLLSIPFREVHSFDLSRSIEILARDLDDPRLTLSQASINAIPYADKSFDFVFCHRVLQHTPDPEASLRAVCRKVRRGGYLFAHSYRRTLLNWLTWKYRYRWLTTRLPVEMVYRFVERYGNRLHGVSEWLSGTKLGYALVRALMPFNYLPPSSRPADMPLEAVIELEKLITFDAMTPTYDKPMSSHRFRSIIESEGFEILYFTATKVSVVHATAKRL